MNYSFHPAARVELHDAVAYYENCQPGLGAEFFEEVHSAIARIMRYPKAWPATTRYARRCLVNRFPYGVIYHVKPGSIRIYAIAHLHRLPGYWRNREEDEG